MMSKKKRSAGERPSHAEQEAELAKRAEQQPDVEAKKSGNTTLEDAKRAIEAVTSNHR